MGLTPDTIECMSTRVLFTVDKEIDFKNHLIVEEFSKNISWLSPEAKEYFKSLRNADGEEKKRTFDEYSKTFYDNPLNKKIAEEIQSKWNGIEDEYISKMETIYKNVFPFETIYGVVSTTPFGYGYRFNEEKPWFACPKDNPLEAVDVATHEIMHAFFDTYFAKQCLEKFGLTDQQVFMIKESLTVLLNLECVDLRTKQDEGYPEHKELREEISRRWVEHRDLDMVLELICSTMKKVGV